MRYEASLLLSYSRSLHPLFKESADIHLGDFPAFLRKRPQEILEVVSRRIESADAIESTAMWDAFKGAESQLLKR